MNDYSSIAVVSAAMQQGVQNAIAAVLPSAAAPASTPVGLLGATAPSSPPPLPVTYVGRPLPVPETNNGPAFAIVLLHDLTLRSRDAYGNVIPNTAGNVLEIYDLHYMVAFSEGGQTGQFFEERMLGGTITYFSANPVLTAVQLAAAATEINQAALKIQAEGKYTAISIEAAANEMQTEAIEITPDTLPPERLAALQQTLGVAVAPMGLCYTVGPVILSVKIPAAMTPQTAAGS